MMNIQRYPWVYHRARRWNYKWHTFMMQILLLLCMCHDVPTYMKGARLVLCRCSIVSSFWWNCWVLQFKYSIRNFPLCNMEENGTLIKFSPLRLDFLSGAKFTVYCVHSVATLPPPSPFLDIIFQNVNASLAQHHLNLLIEIEIWHGWFFYLYLGMQSYASVFF